jgi:hypothetical protein
MLGNDPVQQNPREHPAVGVLTPRTAARDARKGQSPEAAASKADQPLRRLVPLAKQTAGGCIQAETPGYLPGGESSEG